MKIRESGMPEEEFWEKLFDVEMILNRLGVDARLRNVIELGCGYGTFTIPVARRISGTVTTCEIDAAMVKRARARAEVGGVSNVLYRVRDVVTEGFGAETGGMDACLLFNILHCEDPIALLLEAARVVQPGGAMLVIHWRRDRPTPRGPSQKIRPGPENIVAWAEETRVLKADGPVIDLPAWHYGLRLRRVL
jgi:SAM-dependent methyltransferase